MSSHAYEHTRFSIHLLACACTHTCTHAHTLAHTHTHTTNNHDERSVGDKVALVDASHEKFHDLWMDTLEQQLKALGALVVCLLSVYFVVVCSSRAHNTAHTSGICICEGAFGCACMRAYTNTCTTHRCASLSTLRCLRGSYQTHSFSHTTHTGRDKIDYIFVSHTEPDHSGLIPSVLDRHPEATVCGSKVALTFLQVCCVFYCVLVSL